ncbi:uncharacterized protein LOC118658412 isoform X2 [Myotis myotis]|uniref:uncharacterized protein LOC118658412 isoform X2 n=1 Tax=Myotis myotis TaxID=51298 RepID=UPI00174E82B6|nr:uncharacterized protein LOC118658412 isoform X2 [Myotis myotis]
MGLGDPSPSRQVPCPNTPRRHGGAGGGDPNLSRTASAAPVSVSRHRGDCGLSAWRPEHLTRRVWGGGGNPRTKPGPRGGPEDDLRKLRQSARCADGPTALARGPAPRLGGSAARSTFCSTRVSQEGRPTHLLRTPQTPRHAVLSPSLRSKGLGFRLLGANFLPLGSQNSALPPVP